MKTPLPKKYAHHLLRLEGPDAVDFGQRIFTRHLKQLSDGEARLTLMLAADGKVEAIFWALKTQTGLSLVVPATSSARLKELIETYHFAENFELKDQGEIPGFWAKLAPEERLHDNFAGALTEENWLVAQWGELQFSFYLSGDVESVRVSEHLFERARFESLIPFLEIDFDSKILVFELGLDPACDENKGCYTGQEVVERVRSRGGKPAKVLCLVHWDQRPIAGGDINCPEGRSIGKLAKTSLEEGSGWMGFALLKRTVTDSEQISGASINGKILKRQKTL